MEEITTRLDEGTGLNDYSTIQVHYAHWHGSHFTIQADHCLQTNEESVRVIVEHTVGRLKVINLPSLLKTRTWIDVSFIIKLWNGEVNSPVLLNELYITASNRSGRHYVLIKLSPRRTNYELFHPHQASRSPGVQEFIKIMNIS
uniref:Uncharacterized protein n=1 Tax=Glossina austeni TaxID=7395 RepID=A0A1A9V4S2_GLOAU